MPPVTGSASTRRSGCWKSATRKRSSNCAASSGRRAPPQAAAEPAGKRLFADVSDADLTRLGVDAQILPMIRLLTSETDLETLANGAAGGSVRRASTPWPAA